MPEIPVGRITFSLSGHKFEILAPDLKVMLSPQMIHATAKKEGAAEERAACAELVRAAGCQCKGIFLVRYPAYPDDYKHVSPERGGRHFDECPIAIAERIEARERA